MPPKKGTATGELWSVRCHENLESAVRMHRMGIVSLKMVRKVLAVSYLADCYCSGGANGGWSTLQEDLECLT